MRCASQPFYRRLLEFLYSEGLTPIEHETPDEPLEIYRGRDYVCSFFPSGEITYEHESEDLNKVRSFKDKYWDHYVWCEYLDKMQFRDISGYTKFFEVNNAVLGAMILPRDKIQYACWTYNNDRSGVVSGHYCIDDFDEAKEEFAIRAGLIDKRKLFQRADMKAVYVACIHLLVSRDSLSPDQKKRLSNIIERIEDIDKTITDEFKEAFLSPSVNIEDEEDLEV